MSEQNTIFDEIKSDSEALTRALSCSEQLDKQTRHRLRARADKLREELKDLNGEMSIAVDLIRQSRSEA